MTLVDCSALPYTTVNVFFFYEHELSCQGQSISPESQEYLCSEATTRYLSVISRLQIPHDRIGS